MPLAGWIFIVRLVVGIGLYFWLMVRSITDGRRTTAIMAGAGAPCPGES